MIDRQRLLRICNWSLTYNETLAQAQKPVCGDFPSTWENFIGKEPLVLQWGIMEVSNVDLYGSSLFGFKNDEFVLDLGINGNPYYLEKPDVKRACQYARTEFCCKKTYVVDCAVSLCGIWSKNYFHWIFEELPKLEGIEIYTRITGKTPLILIGDNDAPYIRDSLSGYEFSCMSGHIKVKNLLVVTSRRVGGWTFPESAKNFLRRFIPLSSSAPQGKRVYISRDRVKRRQIVNELDVCRDLQTRGFEIVRPEEMTFTEQVHYFRSAKTIVAPHGGGLTNMVWAERPRVIELMPQPYNNPCYWLASSAIAEQYGMIALDGFCDHSAMAKNLRVDIDKINHVLEQMET